MARKKRKKPQPRRQRQRQYDDAWQEPTAKRWIGHVLDEMVPKLEGSAFTISLVPEDREGDVKFWVELGASIMLDKPIIGVVFNDDPVPEKLKLVSEEIVRCPGGVGPEAAEKIQAAMTRVMARLDEAA
jgi:hypothetical protein